MKLTSRYVFGDNHGRKLSRLGCELPLYGVIPEGTIKRNNIARLKEK